jgi:hypothetical protein
VKPGSHITSFVFCWAVRPCADCSDPPCGWATRAIPPQLIFDAWHLTGSAPGHKAHLQQSAAGCVVFFMCGGRRGHRQSMHAAAWNVLGFAGSSNPRHANVSWRWTAAQQQTASQCQQRMRGQGGVCSIRLLSEARFSRQGQTAIAATAAPAGCAVASLHSCCVVFLVASNCAQVAVVPHALCANSLVTEQ